MRKVLGLMTVAALLAACDDRSAEDTTTGGGGGVTPTVPTGGEIAVGDVEAVSFDGETLLVRVALDGDSVLEEYETAGPGDTVNGYQRFTQNVSSLNRSYTALAGEAGDGSLVAVVTADGGQFNRFFGGASVVQNDLSAPAGGLVSYQGTYAGLNNAGPAIPPAVPGAPPTAFSSDAATVTGQVFLNADFTDNKVEGAIYDREWDNDGTPTELDDLTLIVGDIAAGGTFSGSVEIGQGSEAAGAGTYSGAFGGTDAAFAGGVLDIDPAAYGEDADPNLKEFGIFIIGQCPGGNAESCFPSPP